MLSSLMMMIVPETQVHANPMLKHSVATVL